MYEKNITQCQYSIIQRKKYIMLTTPMINYIIMQIIKSDYLRIIVNNVIVY